MGHALNRNAMVGPMGRLGAASDNSSDLAGPVLAGALMALGGLGIVFVVDALTSLVAVATILRVAMPQRSL